MLSDVVVLHYELVSATPLMTVVSMFMGIICATRTLRMANVALWCRLFTWK